MTPRALAMLWLSGDTLMRPRYIAQEAALRAALADPVKAAHIVAEINNGSRHPSCGKTFAMHMAEYRSSPELWRATEVIKWERQQAIDQCRRVAGGAFTPIRIARLPG